MVIVEMAGCFDFDDVIMRRAQCAARLHHDDLGAGKTFQESQWLGEPGHVALAGYGKDKCAL